MSTAPSAGSRAAATFVTPRPASTVMLLRDGGNGIEVFTVQRASTMAFVAGATVFPGGSVDPSDEDPGQPWLGPDAGAWAARLGTSAELARQLVCAAGRETFEECGVLLAAHAGAGPVRDATLYAKERRLLESHALSFHAFLGTAGLAFDTRRLTAFSHWITPAGEPRRYDTRFFLAALPDGQTADAETSEVVSAQWRTPAAAIDDFRAGRTMLIPPTWAQLVALADFSSVASAMAAKPALEPVEPTLIETPDGLRIEFDGDARYYAHHPGFP